MLFELEISLLEVLPHLYIFLHSFSIKCFCWLPKESWAIQFYVFFFRFLKMLEITFPPTYFCLRRLPWNFIQICNHIVLLSFLIRMPVKQCGFHYLFLGPFAKTLSFYWHTAEMRDRCHPSFCAAQSNARVQVIYHECQKAMPTKFLFFLCFLNLLHDFFSIFFTEPW